MTHGSLFSGIGGFDLAAEWMGWQNVFHCEWNTFGQRVLKHYWPNAISYNDITTTDFTIHRGRIDIITGGFPCQPYSMAGKRLGKEDDRHLWPEMLRAIREIQPRWVVGENVLGLVNWSDGLVFHEVQADLEAEGYEVQPFVLPAVSVNASHRRDRVWFVAHTKDNGYGRRHKFREDIRVQEWSLHKYQGQGWDEIRPKPKRPYEKWSSSNANDTRADIGLRGERERQESDIIGGLSQPESWAIGGVGTAPDTDSCATGTPGEGGGIEGNGSANNVQQGKRGGTTEQHNRPSAFSWDAADTDSARIQGLTIDTGTSKEIRQGWESIEKTWNVRPVGNWQTFPTQSPICHGNDGISARLDGITFSKWRQESIKAGGNAVVPQVVLQIFKAIEEYEKMNAQ